MGGAVPFQEAKWARFGNRVMSPASTSSRAAPEGPMPCRSITVVPVAATSSFNSGAYRRFGGTLPPHWVVPNQIAQPPLVTEEQFVVVQASFDEPTSMANRQLISGLNPP